MFSNVSYEAVNDSIPAPLIELTTDQASAASGQAVFVERDAGHCVLCHQVESLNAPFQGDLGPALSDVGSRLSPGQIRFRLVDPSRLNPNTIMPSYYKTDHLRQLPDEYKGQPVLNELQIEQLVVYLTSLKG
jgi:sulfur-oxidizing protein SoxX